MYRLGILASHNGTDLQAIIDQLEAGALPGITISVVISNNQRAYALQRARDHGIEALHIDTRGLTAQAYDQKLIHILQERQVDLVCLVGYMRILTPEFIQAFHHKIINVHPSLIPKFSGPGYYGMKVHRAVIKNREKETGCTFHYVDKGVDTGKIILQKTVAVDPNDTPETLKIKVQALEQKWYPQVIQQLSKKQK